MKKEVRPIDANALVEKIREYMDDYPNAGTRLAVCRTFLSMLGDEQQTPTLKSADPLTLEQLESMEGMPVYLVPVGSQDWAPHWDVMQNGSFIASSMTDEKKRYYLFPKRGYTESWIAYSYQLQPKAYDLGFGHLGNGITVWNRLEEVGGDYRRIAHITPDRKVRIYDDDMPQKVRDRIQQVAMTSDMTVSATQDIPVFTTPPTLPTQPTGGLTMETAKDKICPMSRKLCMQEQCAWWCKFAQDCSVPLLAGMFADSEICRNVWEDD